MQRITISVEEELAEAFDLLLAEEGYQSRSEAMRDLVRCAVDARRLRSDDNELCVANLSYVYDHHTRDLAQRLTELQHDYHDMVVSSTHVHLDHDTCLESTILKGPAGAVRRLGACIQAERGVRFGAINVVSSKAAGKHASVSPRKP